MLDTACILLAHHCGKRRFDDCLRLRLNKSRGWNEAMENLSHRSMNLAELKAETDYNAKYKECYEQFEST